MTLLVEKGLGLEKIARETVIILIDNLNAEIAVQDSAYTQLDKDLAAKRGVAYEPITLERIETTNFHLGFKPSLIEAPIDQYPNVTVLAHNAIPKEEELDTVNIYEVALAIEVMCKASDTDGLDFEEIVNRRTARTIDAVHNVMASNKTLNGKVQEMDTAPSVELSEVFLRREQTSYGQFWCWQGARLEYPVTKLSDYS